MKLQPVFVDTLPALDEVKAGQIWISPKHRTINLRCPCGCGTLTVLTIHPSRWHVHFDGKTVSLAGPTGGSIWANSGCGSHYCIRNNKVVWMKPIDPVRHADYAEAERGRMRGDASVGLTPMASGGWICSGLAHLIKWIRKKE